MMKIDGTEHRRAFSVWLRTGRLPTVSDDGVELKFNPYHDPQDGRFTFAPGGPRSLNRVVTSYRRQPKSASARANVSKQPISSGKLPKPQENMVAQTDGGPMLSDAVYRLDETTTVFQPIRFPRIPRSRGSNSRAFEDPMRLEQAFPGLREAPGGAVLAMLDNVFDFTGPGREAVGAYMLNKANILLSEIRAIDPNYRFDSFGFPPTLQGQINQVNGLRFDRAATLLRVRGDIEPMQVETMRFLQIQTDRAYDRGLKLIRAGRLPIRLSEQEALGNYIDREVRGELRGRYGWAQINSSGAGPIRVNRRENETSESETTFRRPDARVGSVAYDVTLTQKSLKTPQIVGFFNADFKPDHVVIIRPQKLGPDSSYIITRPETKR